MPGIIRGKDLAIVSLANANGGSTTSGSATAATSADLDCRESVAGNFQGAWQGTFQLTCQWATITSIAKDTIAAELYLVPKMDGTNLPTLDTTAGSSALPYPWLKGLFTCVKAPTANTDMIFVTDSIVLPQRLYTGYILNRSGQTISANWTLKAVADSGAYT